MKKFVTLILILALVVSCSCASAVAAWLIDGVWTHMETTATGCLITSLYLTEDGTAYYVTQLFRDGEPGLGRAFVGSWSFTGSNTLHVIIGNNSSIDLTYCTGNMMYDYEMRDYYFRAELRDGDKVP